MGNPRKTAQNNGELPMLSQLTVEQAGSVARLVLNRPPLNTLDVDFMGRLSAAVRQLSSGSGAKPRALVLASNVAGQFSQGIDPQAVLTTDVYGRKQIFLALA